MIRRISLTDNELIYLLKAGDESAFKELYNRYWKKLLAIAYNYTRDKSDSEEVVQEVFISIWDRKHIIHIDCLESYLATSVKFSVFKQLQRQKRRQEIAAFNFTPGEIELDEQKINAKFLQEYIDGIVEKLPEKCQMVFKYSRGSGMTIPEIAREMSIAEKTVESHLTKALKVIRVNLHQSCIFAVFISDQLS